MEGLHRQLENKGCRSYQFGFFITVQNMPVTADM